MPEVDLQQVIKDQAGINEKLSEAVGILQKELKAYQDLLRKVGKFLDERIATLPCESRQRDLPEDDWDYAMYLRDDIDLQLNKKAREYLAKKGNL